MPFDRSQIKVLSEAERPWRWTTPPNPDGTGGVKGTPLTGVFVMMSDALVDELRQHMTQAEKDQVAPWVNRYTEAQCAEWHVPVWAGQNSAVYWRIPAGTWASPDTAPPTNVKRFFRHLFRDLP